MEIEIKVKRLAEINNPFGNSPWGYRINHSDVLKAIEAKSFEPTPKIPNKRSARRYHINRIAYLVVHGWTDSIEVDVGVPFLGYNPDWIIIDGNHRFAASLYRGDETIKALLGGDINYGLELLEITKDTVTI